MSGEILTVLEVAALPKVADKTVNSMARKGEFPAFKVRGQWRFHRTDIDAWILSQTAFRGAWGAVMHGPLVQSAAAPRVRHNASSAEAALRIGVV